MSDQIVDAMVMCGMNAKDAYRRFWLFDRQGLLTEGDTALTDAQKPYARSCADFINWPQHENKYPSLIDAVRQIKPTILIGCSAQPGAFSQHVIECMAQHCERPIVFPLSNPDDKCEAQPSDILLWSQGQALIATGTAFKPIPYQDHLVHIAQCNNALVFPGIGLGIQAVKATRLSKAMIWAAARALSELSPSKKDPFLPILPLLDEAQAVAKHIAVAVARTAIETGLAQCNQEKDLEAWVQEIFWEPHYLPFKRVAICD